MLVPAMNEKEREAEIRRDFARIEKSTAARLGGEYDRERRKLKIDKSCDYNKVYPIKTAGKNQWLIFVKKATAKAKYKEWGDATFFCIVYYYTKHGINACRITTVDGELEFYYGHFFSRYNERQKLKLPDNLCALKHFFNNNESLGSILSPTIETKESGTVLVQSPCKEGLALGNYHISTKYTVYKTFVSNDLLSKYQRSIEEILNEPYKEVMIDTQPETNRVAA
jgi:hypothetical protein